MNRFKNKIKLNIKGKNIDRFINRLIKHNIEIISLEKIKYNEIDIIIFKKDLELINEIKTIYEIKEIRTYGIINITNRIKMYKYLLIFITIGYLIIFVLSNMIFDVKIVYNDKKIRALLKQELKINGISKYRFKKDYHEIEKIKNRILSKYNRKLEWLEIESSGTKYIVRLEERKITKEPPIFKNRNIIAKKNGIITHIEASNGEIIKNKNDYVKKGDIIVKGEISLNDEIKNVTSANGKVEAEVWYTVTLNVPYKENYKKKTGNSKKILSINFLNKSFELFNFKKYKNKISDNKYIIHNRYIPFNLVLQKQYETKIIRKKFNKKTIDEAAYIKAKSKLQNKYKNIDILNYKIISKKDFKSYVKFKLFFSVKEDITEYKEIYVNEIPS